MGLELKHGLCKVVKKKTKQSQEFAKYVVCLGILEKGYSVSCNKLLLYIK